MTIGEGGSVGMLEGQYKTGTLNWTMDWTVDSTMDWMFRVEF